MNARMEPEVGLGAPGGRLGGLRSDFAKETVLESVLADLVRAKGSLNDGSLALDGANMWST